MKSKIDLDYLLQKPFTLSEKFHQKTKLVKLAKKETKDKSFDFDRQVRFKSYARFQEIHLPRPKLDNSNLKETLLKRRSIRAFSGKKISLGYLSSLLYFSAGLKTNRSPWQADRFYPSAGSRYPLELYVLSLNSQLPKGLYHYYLKNHSLEKLISFDKFETGAYFKHDWVSQAALVIIISAVFRRNTTKYGDRGYRYLLIEAGHLGQNIYLTSTALKLSCCSVGGFFDDALNGLIDIDGIYESIIYAVAVG